MRPRLTQIPPERPYTQAIAAWGDSLTEQQGAETPWITALANDLGIPGYNGGKSGKASSDIALLQGGLTLKLTLTGNEIPASGAVTVTAIDPTTSFRSDAGGLSLWSGTLAGVAGQLLYNMATGAWTFTRTTPGSAVSVSAGTPFICTTGDAYVSWIQTDWIGRNNLTAEGPTITDVSRDIALMIGHTAAFNNNRSLVLGIINNSTEPVGSANLTAILAINATLSNTYGNRYIDIRSWSIANGLAIAGISPAIGDFADINNSIIPRSIRADATHYNDAGYTGVWKCIGQRIRLLRWVPGKFPASPPGTPSSAPTIGDATDTTQALSWPAIGLATSYEINFRQSGASAWIVGGYTTTTSIVVQGLNPGTSYEYVLKAWNVAGPSAASLSASGATTGVAPVIIASDSFNRANADLNAQNTDSAYGGTTKAWTSYQIGIVSNRVVRTGFSSVRYGQVDAGSIDGRVQITIGDVGGEVSLTGRYTDPSNCYRCVVNTARNITIYKVVSGVQTNLSGATVLTGLARNGDVLEFSIAGTTLSAKWNGITALSLTDAAIEAGTRWGFGLAQDATNAIDNFVLYDK